MAIQKPLVKESSSWNTTECKFRNVFRFARIRISMINIAVAPLDSFASLFKQSHCRVCSDSVMWPFTQVSLRRNFLAHFLSCIYKLHFPFRKDGGVGQCEFNGKKFISFDIQILSTSAACTQSLHRQTFQDMSAGLVRTCRSFRKASNYSYQVSFPFFMLLK